MREFLEMCGGFVRLGLRSLGCIVPCKKDDVWIHLEEMIADAWHIVMITCFFTGGVLAMQSADAFIDINMSQATLFIPRIVTKSMLLELGPVFTALILAGRSGAGIAAQISSMNVSRQVHALRALAIDPVVFLVTPRVYAMLLGLPMLVILADLAGVFGGLLYCAGKLQMTAAVFLKEAADTVYLKDILGSLLKTLVWGGLIAVMGALHGLRARGGIVGVGQATRDTVVHSMILILISDFFLTRIFRIVLSYFIG
ncbi:MAG: ABC transporter permease [Candidatus Riflebacteria bacterium]|nr:ABC transporter permease [Candidatus Riflebacteria bacterium]